MNIDWSKAPEKATHFCTVNRGFYKFTPEETGFFGFAGFEPSGRKLDFYKEGVMIARPAGWSGTGLPPVGIVCEISMKPSASKHAVDVDRYKDHIGLEVEIIAHHDIGGGCSAAVYAIQRDFVFEYHSLIEGNFRPVRTPEQIAADERDKAVQQMLDDSSILSGTQTNRRILCEELYSAGYRKEAAK